MFKGFPNFRKLKKICPNCEYKQSTTPLTFAGSIFTIKQKIFCCHKNLNFKNIFKFISFYLINYCCIGKKCFNENLKKRGNSFPYIVLYTFYASTIKISSSHFYIRMLRKVKKWPFFRKGTPSRKLLARSFSSYTS